VHPRCQLLDGIGNKTVQQVAVSVGEKNGLAMIAPQGDMVEAAGDMQTDLARHRAILDSNCNGYKSLEPDRCRFPSYFRADHPETAKVRPGTNVRNWDKYESTTRHR
jgi:hypothetical protein